MKELKIVQTVLKQKGADKPDSEEELSVLRVLMTRTSSSPATIKFEFSKYNGCTELTSSCTESQALECTIDKDYGSITSFLEGMGNALDLLALFKKFNFKSVDLVDTIKILTAAARC